MDWKKILKGLTTARDVINSVGAPRKRNVNRAKNYSKYCRL